MEIRRGNPGDIPDIKRLLIDSWIKHAQNEPALLNEERMRRSDVEGYYKKAFDNPDKSIVLVAEESDRFAGFLRADVKKLPSFFRYSKTLFIDDLCVDPDFRRTGVSRLLLWSLEQLAVERRIRRLQARVYTFNEPMQFLLSSEEWDMPHSTWDKLL